MERKEIESLVSILHNRKEWLTIHITACLKKLEIADNIPSALQIPTGEIYEAILIASRLYAGSNEESILNSETGPLSRCGRLLVHKQLKEGLLLNDFMLFLKCLRQTYLECLNNEKSKSVSTQTFSFFIERCFDQIELAAVDEWMIASQDMHVNNINMKHVQSIYKNHQYLNIFMHHFSPLFIISEKQRIININQEASAILPDLRIGDEIINLNFDSEQDKSGFLESYNNFQISKDDRFIFETNLLTSKGKRNFRINVKKLRENDYLFNNTLMMLEDLTDIRKINNDIKLAKSKAEEADRLKTAFLANMSHEIRTPMHAIIGFTELLINGNYDVQERKEYLNLIRRSSNDLLNIIEDLIDIAKMESNQLKIRYNDCQPYKLLNSLLPVFHNSLRSHGIQNEVQLIHNTNERDKGLHLFTDGERLKQVISNLINNAIKFTDRGFIEFGYRQTNKDQLLFYVRDSGVGIPETMKDNIFDRFYQVEAHQKKSHGGAGLGLAICKNIINLLGGSIWLESTVNSGSCFYFQIPVRNVPRELRLKSETRSNSSIPDWSNKRILVAEDDNINFVYIKEVLTRAGAMVFHAKNGTEAIDLADSVNKIDLILMDIKMPEIDGLEAARYISKARPEVPVIALTAFAMEGDKQKCLKAGCVAYISKPIDKETLYNIVDKYIRLSKSNPIGGKVKIK